MMQLTQKSPSRGPQRTGVTLTEVLMSLMIMSIGLSSVAVLFPISMHRSIEATQLTNAAILKGNVEALINADPDMVFDPDGDGDYVEHFRNPADRNYVVDPAGYYTLIGDGNSIFSTFGNDGVTALGVPRFGTGILTLAGEDSSAGAAQQRAISLAANKLSTMGTRWDTIIDAVPTGYSAGVVAFSADVSLVDVPTSAQLVAFTPPGFPHLPDPELYRIVLFDSFDRSVTYPLLAVDGNTAIFTEDVNLNGTLDGTEDFNANGFLDQRDVPAEFGWDATAGGYSTPRVVRAFIQSQRTNDFRWLLNVRRRGDGQVRGLDIVVKFADGVDASQERVFEATFISGSTFVGVRTGGDGVEPSIRKGKFVFDALNSLWYRVQDVEEASAANTAPWAGAYNYRVTLEEPASANAGSDAADGLLDGSDTAGFSAAMFPKGIVDVYPIVPPEFPTR